MKIRVRSVAVAAVGALLLAGCGSEGETSSTPTNAASVDVGDASAVTPPDADVLAAAKKEGTVLVYTDADDQLMEPIRKGFEAKYPDIKVNVVSVGGSQVYQRYATEKATNAKTADVVMTTSMESIKHFVDGGDILDYEDPNVPNLPADGKVAPGVNAVSLDPVIAVYNKAVLPDAKQPTSLAALADLSTSMKGKIGTVDIGNPVGLGATEVYTEGDEDAAWATLDKLGANSKAESNVGPLVQKLLQGQYGAAFFVSGAIRALITPEIAKLLDWKYLSDATPVIPRTIAVTNKGADQDAGKVFVNYMLSVEGQEAACKGGFTPYRDGVKCDFGVPAIKQATGSDKLDVLTLDRYGSVDVDDLTARWNKAFGR